MKITITMDLTAENLRKLEALIPDTVEFTEGPDPKKEQTTAEVPSNYIAPKAESAQTKVSQTDIRAAAIALSKANKQDVLAEIFNKFGGKKLSDFDSRPEIYPDLMRELVKAND